MLPEGDLGDTKVLAALLGISEMVAGLSDLEEVLGIIVRITPQLVGVDRCAVLLYDERKREFRTAQVFGPDPERNAVYQRLVIKEDDVLRLAHRILEQKLPALIRAGSLPPNMAESLGMRMVLMAPLVCRERVLGIMMLDHTKGQGLFTSKEINVVVAVAQQAAIAIDNARLKAEAARVRARLRVASELLSDGVITLTEDGRILSLDPAAEELLMWRTEEVAGQGLADAFALVDSDGARIPAIPRPDLVHRTGMAREPYQLYFRRKDGGHVLCEVRAAPVRDDTAGIIEVVCALRRVHLQEGEIVDAVDSPVPRKVINVQPAD